MQQHDSVQEYVSRATVRASPAHQASHRLASIIFPTRYAPCIDAAGEEHTTASASVVARSHHHSKHSDEAQYVSELRTHPQFASQHCHACAGWEWAALAALPQAHMQTCGRRRTVLRRRDGGCVRPPIQARSAARGMPLHMPCQSPARILRRRARYTCLPLRGTVCPGSRGLWFCPAAARATLKGE